VNVLAPVAPPPGASVKTVTLTVLGVLLGPAVEDIGRWYRRIELCCADVGSRFADPSHLTTEHGTKEAIHSVLLFIRAYNRRFAKNCPETAAEKPIRAG